MITKEQALTANEFHFGDCKVINGPRGGKCVRIETWRRNGQTQTWKTRPEEFKVPIMHGLYNHSYLTHKDAENFHTPEECPLRLCEQAVMCDHCNAPGQQPNAMCRHCGAVTPAT